MAKDFTPSSRNREAFEAMTDTVGNVPPQAVELEEAVLGALMLEKDCIITVQEFVSPEAFYTEEHRLIYKAINELSMELKPIDLYTVTERLKAKKELKKVGYVIYDENDNTLIWDGETCEPSFEPIDTYEDHRMALAFAPLAFKFPQIEINNPEVVSKSYPHYWEDLEKVGFEIVNS